MKKNIGLIILCCIIVLITFITLKAKPYTYNEPYPSNDDNYTNTELNTNYLSINNVTITHDSVSTICTGSISVSLYSPYKYRFIEVKGAFKDKSGTTIDTDWTYAIGSEWLQQGESSKFKLYVDKDYSITDCSVTIMK